MKIQQAALDAGDYSLLGFEDRAAIERKRLDDLVSCLMNSNRDRFERELARGGDMSCLLWSARDPGKALALGVIEAPGCPAIHPGPECQVWSSVYHGRKP